VIRNNRLAGVVLFGDTADAFWYRDLIRQASPLTPIRALLAFGRAHAEAA
jgi:nitrite reductase (NADH) large subunit